MDAGTEPRPDGPAAVFASTTGRVAAFDDHVGSGTVTSHTSGAQWFFHCTRIADGRRTIEVGADVEFEVVPGPTGFEAVSLRPTASA